MYYFGYCTWLEDAELRKYFPEAKFVTKAKAHNHAIEFRAAGSRQDRGWCHLANVGKAFGRQTHGIVFECRDDRIHDEFDDFVIVFLTVYGDDGRMYDCFTYVLSNPGTIMRPPNYYWNHVPRGLEEQGFPVEYIKSVQAVYEAAAECPDADRIPPAAKPGKDASTR